MSKTYCEQYWRHSAPPENDPLTPARLRYFIDSARARAVTSVLDVGCGNGQTTTLDFERHFDVTGPHIRFFTDRSLAQALDQSGFQVDNVKHQGRFFPVWMDTTIYETKLL